MPGNQRSNYLSRGTFLASKESEKDRSLLARLFSSESRAFLLVIVLSAAVAIIYLVAIHIESGRNCTSNTTENAELCDSSTKPWAQSVKRDPTGYVAVDYNDSVLLRLFSAEKVSDFKADLEADLEVWRDDAFARRLAAYEYTANFFE